MSLILLPLAAQDIAEAIAYLNRANIRAVEPFRQAVVRVLRRLEANPGIGRHSRSEGIREWSIPDWPYLIPYRILDGDVEVLRVWHTKRRQPANWN